MSAVTDLSLTALADVHEAAEAAHDTAGVAATFAEDGILDPKPTGTTFSGHADITSWYQDLFTALPDIAPELVNGYQDGDTVIDEVIFTGTDNGPSSEAPPPANAVTVPAWLVYETRDGKMVRESAYCDVATMLIQMGILPPPGA